MITRQEFLQNELYREVQNAICSYQLERISVNELVILLSVILKKYSLESNGAVKPKTETALISQKK
jgi:hypothetical protein